MDSPRRVQLQAPKLGPTDVATEGAPFWPHLSYTAVESPVQRWGGGRRALPTPSDPEPLSDSHPLTGRPHYATLAGPTYHRGVTRREGEGGGTQAHPKPTLPTCHSRAARGAQPSFARRRRRSSSEESDSFPHFVALLCLCLYVRSFSARVSVSAAASRVGIAGLSGDSSCSPPSACPRRDEHGGERGREREQPHRRISSPPPRGSPVSDPDLHRPSPIPPTVCSLNLT